MQILILGQVEFFAQARAGDEGAGGQDVQYLGYFFGVQADFQVGAQSQILVGQTGELFFQFSEKLLVQFVHLYFKVLSSETR